VNSITLVSEMTELIKSIIKNRHRLFILSNIFEEVYIHLKNEFPIMDIFDGKALSFKLKAAKPEPSIYIFLLNTYNLNAAEIIFIDDKQVNIDAASILGIEIIKFKNPYQCKRQFKKYGVV
jgi:HAD superfamily hydrolase (TIGR01509 family)